MGSTAVIALIDRELARLHKVRAILIKHEKNFPSAKKAVPSLSPSENKGEAPAHSFH